MTIKEFIATVIDNNNESLVAISQLLDKMSDMLNINKNKYLKIIDENIAQITSINGKITKINSNFKDDVKIDVYFEILTYLESSIILFNKIHSNFLSILSKSKNVETFLSQTYLEETIEFHKKISEIYLKINKDNIISNVVNKVVEREIKIVSYMSDENILKYIERLQKLYHDYPLSQDIYLNIISTIMKEYVNWHTESQKISTTPQETTQIPKIIFNIKNIIENDKTFILNKYTNIKKINKIVSLNPYYKTYNLIPITPSITINDVSMTIFKEPSKTLKDFIKICKQKDYGLIIFNKKIANPITYDVSKLLNWQESKNFDAIHKKTYGVDIPLLERNKTIDKIPIKRQKWNFEIEKYIFTFDNYDKERDKYVIILDSLAIDQYRICCNYLSTYNKFFIKVSSIYELYHHNKNTPTRKTDLNIILQKKAIKNIFSPIKLDLTKVKEISIIVDPKYLRNQIYLRMNDVFLEILEKKYKNGKDVVNSYIYANIIHDDKFLGIYSKIIIHEFYTYIYNNYNEYVMGHINIGEILSSFLNTVYINQRTFTKEIHDYFKNNPFDFKDTEKMDVKLKAHFDLMNSTVLGKLITTESNIYQTILYKINILKNSFI